MAMGIWLPGGGGADLDAVTAGAGDVLAGKVILDSEGEPLTGTMPERGNWSSSELSAGASITIPGGHHSGSGKVTAKSLSAQTSGTATAAQILSGKTAWVNGSEVTGSMANRGNYGGAGNSRGNDAPNQRMWVKVPGGYYNENAQVFLNWADIRSMAGLTPDKIKKNVSIMGIIGAHDGFVPGPMDVYNRGSWGSGYGTASITPTYSYGSIEYKNSNIVSYGGANNGRFKAFDVTISKQGNPINLQPYKTVNVVYSTNTMNLGGEWEVKIRLSGNSEIYTEGKESATERTISLNISNVGITDKIQIYGVSEHWDTIYIYRVYFT
jgi:hypothetical protein|nr:MAG TPA: tail protein [Caudoviricetes sp.]